MQQCFVACIIVSILCTVQYCEQFRVYWAKFCVVHYEQYSIQVCLSTKA